MRAADQHALARSIRRLAIGVVRDVDSRRRGRDVAALAEREEQFQIAVSGIATDYPAWATVKLDFDTQFTSLATGNRMSMLQRPQVTTGFELTSVERQNADTGVWEPTDAGVVCVALVRDYSFDAANAINGATVQCCAIAPGDELMFTGFAHVSFQGLGAPGDDQPDEDG